MKQKREKQQPESAQSKVPPYFFLAAAPGTPRPGYILTQIQQFSYSSLTMARDPWKELRMELCSVAPGTGDNSNFAIFERHVNKWNSRKEISLLDQ
eukprot:752264-Hanusia_phi.AAC.4